VFSLLERWDFIDLDVLFLSVAQLRRLGMGLKFLAGTNLFALTQISKTPHDLQNLVPKSCTMMGGRGAREARARGWQTEGYASAAGLQVPVDTR